MEVLKDLFVNIGISEAELNKMKENILISIGLVQKKLIKLSNYFNENSSNIRYFIKNAPLIEKVYNIQFSALFLKNNPNILNFFIDKGICPPVYYFIEDIICNNSFKFDNFINDCKGEVNIKEFINDNHIKEYYSDSMNGWIKNESKDYIAKFIKEIQFNFDRNNIYSTTLNLFTLIEYKVRESAISKGTPIKYNITSNIKKILNENCFKYTSSNELTRLSDTFLDKSSKYYLYKGTDKNPMFITRHMLHGDRLDLINKESMMSLIFLTDFLYKTLI